VERRIVSAERTDAIVVGLGAVGGIVAEQLTAAGLRVVGIEKGARFEQEDFRLKHDEIRYYARGAIVPSMTSDPITWRATTRDVAVVLPWSSGPLGVDEPLFGMPSIGTGGGTIHWGGASFRFPASEFRMRSVIAERFGEAALPADTTLVDWPFPYEELERYYDRVEWEQGISGAAGNIRGELRSGGNPFESPRSRDYPMPPLRAAPGDALFAEACSRLGYHPYPIPASINTVPYKGRDACVYCGFCHGFPCHVGAKASTQVTSIPAALATGNLEIRSHARVVRVLRSGDRVCGVAYVGPDGREQELLAEIVVLAAYSLDNTRLLLLSDINRGGNVGKNFMTHNFGWFNAVLPEETNPFVGTLVAGSAVDDIGADRIPDNDEGVLWGSPIVSFPTDVQPLEAVHSMNPEVPRWGGEFKEWLRSNYLRLFRMYSQTTNFPSPRHSCDLDPTVRDPLGLPALRITHDWDDHDAHSVEYFSRVKHRIAEEMGVRESWEHSSRPFYHLSTHEVGVHRMGEDPAASVVDPYGESHECGGLWVLGGGQFPSYGGYNPTLTIQALAYRAADRLLDQLGVAARSNSVALLDERTRS
jgi:gluconate 2-dehydrogenase alpha chain